MLVAGAFILAFFLRFDFGIPHEQFELLKKFILLVAASKLVIYYFAGIYGRIWRYAGIRDFYIIFWSSILGTLANTVIIYFIYRVPFPRSVIILDGILTVAFVGGLRFATRGIRELRLISASSRVAKPLLIAGAGDSGEAILREIQSHPGLAYHPVGFIDDDPRKQGVRLHGVKVLGTCHQLRQLINRYRIEEVIICMPSVSREVIRDIFFQCQEEGVACKTLPGIYQIVDGTARVEQIREVGVEDILGREPVKTDLEVAGYITGKVVLVSGAGGSIGSEICRQISRLKPSALIMVDQSESSLFQIEQEIVGRHSPASLAAVILDINNRPRTEAIFERYRPDVVFHAAAYKHVPLMEANPVEAIENNIFGTKTFAELAVKSGVERFVAISTDKAVEPTSVMGASKALAEQLLQMIAHNCSSTKFMIVRFGNVLDSSGSVVPTFRQQIARGGPVTVTHPEMTRYFMTIPEATQLVIQAGAIGQGGEIFVLDMGEQVSILELAKNMIKLSGFEPEKDIPINFSGIRPGEKLCEKLLWDHEEAVPTGHEKILMVKSEVDITKFIDDLRLLETSVNACDANGIVAQLSRIYGFSPLKTKGDYWQHRENNQQR